MKLKGDLFEGWRPPELKVGVVKKRGHAGLPGNGPEGETCKTCKHYTIIRLSKDYRKCGLTRPKWTGGPGTDIRAGDPACEFWEAE